jgi:hypothetical protein
MKKVLFFAVPVLLFMSCSKTDITPQNYYSPVPYPSSIYADFVMQMEEPKNEYLDGDTELKVGDNVTLKVMVQIQNDFIVSGEIAFLNAEEVDTPEIERITVPVYQRDRAEYSLNCPDNTCDDWVSLSFTVPQSLEGRTIGMTLLLHGNNSNATTTLTPAFKVVQ